MRLQESGILDHMNAYYRDLMYRNRRRNTRNHKRSLENEEGSQGGFEPSKLSGSIQTVFYIYLMCMAVCICVFAMEVASRYIKRRIVAWAYRVIYMP
jgi:hypothetical protein